MRCVMEIHKSEHAIHNGSAANKIQERKGARSEHNAAPIMSRYFGRVIMQTKSGERVCVRA